MLLLFFFNILAILYLVLLYYPVLIVIELSAACREDQSKSVYIGLQMFQRYLTKYNPNGINPLRQQTALTLLV